jgi:ABC-type Mn2+/Zn2+ transport system permease subunit
MFSKFAFVAVTGFFVWLYGWEFFDAAFAHADVVGLVVVLVAIGEVLKSIDATGKRRKIK